MHFSTGLWLEFDDLKYPHCITHRRFTLPASQFHLIFWEAGSSKVSQLPNTLPDNTPTQRVSKVVDIFEDVAPSLSDDAYLKQALTGKDINEAASTWDSSIGSTTLLDTFEGLSHSDIVTLTLVEVKEDAKKNALTSFQEMVTGTAECTITDTSHLLEKSSFYQMPCSVKNKKAAKNVSPTPEVILPSVVKTPESVDHPKVGKCPPALHSSSHSASNLPYLFHRHPSHQSTPLRGPLCATHSKADVRFDGNEALLAKPAELFVGYKTKNSPTPLIHGGLLRHPFVKLPTVPPVSPVSKLIKSASQNIHNPSSPSKLVVTTEALRLKLMKRLKAKKKKLAKLNQLLCTEESESTPRPDSTDISSPYSVTSSTSACDSPAFDNFFAEFLSPAMNTSNLSPDSTGHLEILTNSQSAVTESSSHQNSVPASKLPVPLLNDHSLNSDRFLDEFMSESREQQSAIDNVELNALDIFF